MDLSNFKNTYEGISRQTINKNRDIFNKSSKKLISKKDKFWSLLIDYHIQSQEFMVFLKPINQEFFNKQLVLGLDL